MRAPFSTILVTLAILPCCATGEAAPAPGPSADAHADMHYRLFDPGDPELRPSLAGSLHFEVNSGEQPRVQPPYVSDAARLARAVFGDGSERRWAAVDESGGKGTGYDTLYFDSNNDGDLTNEPPLRGETITEPFKEYDMPAAVVRRTTTIGPVETFVLVGGTPVKRAYWVTLTQSVQEQAMSEPWGLLSPAGYYEGKLRIGEKELLVALLDDNGSGTYNDALTMRPLDKSDDRIASRHDTFLIDMDGDGRFTESLKPGRALSPGPFLMLNGQCFDLTVAPDGSSVSLSSCKSPCGWIDSTETYSATLISGAGACTFTGPGLNCLPVGDYFALSCDITRRDDAGSEWSIPGRTELFRGDPPIRIKKNRTQNLPIGPPFTAQMRVEGPFNSDAVYRVELDITGRAGESYSWLGITKDGQWVPDPDVEIRNAKGELVERGRIEYTRHSDAIVNCFVWRCPAAGKYTLTPIVNLGPFEVKCVPIRFTAGQPQN